MAEEGVDIGPFQDIVNASWDGFWLEIYFEQTVANNSVTPTGTGIARLTRVGGDTIEGAVYPAGPNNFEITPEVMADGNFGGSLETISSDPGFGHNRKGARFIRVQGGPGRINGVVSGTQNNATHIEIIVAVTKTSIIRGQRLNFLPNAFGIPVPILPGPGKVIGIDSGDTPPTFSVTFSLDTGTMKLTTP